MIRESDAKRVDEMLGRHPRRENEEADVVVFFGTNGLSVVITPLLYEDKKRTMMRKEEEIKC
jgi:hypothetical protein